MTDYNEQIFSGGEFVLTQTAGEDGNPQFVGGGYKINLFNSELSPLTTLNTSKSSNNDSNVSSLFENLAIPSGLYYNHKKMPKEECSYLYEPHNVLSDDIFDKLFGLVEYDKKKKRKTRKQNGEQMQTKRKTRRKK